MSAQSFRELYQAERKSLSAHHHQETLSTKSSSQSADHGKKTSQIAEKSDDSKDAPPEMEPGPPELLELEVKLESTDYVVSESQGDHAQLVNGDSNTTSIDDLSPSVSPGRGIPFVSYVPDDLVALCSSGGGIRSAVFNLGVLQGLSKLDLLPLFDYHSTVSGGGYLGGWWTTWRANNRGSLYPKPDSHLVEHAAIRRLRERSRFLSPTGFALSAEIWSGLLLWAVGLAGTLLMAFSIVGLAITIWSGLRSALESSGLTHDAHLWILLPVAVVVSGLSELVPESRKSVVRSIGVGFFLASFVVLACDGLWKLALWANEDGPLAGLISSIAVGGISSAAIRSLAAWVFKHADAKAPNSLMVRISKCLPQLLAGVAIGSMVFLFMFVLQIVGWVDKPSDFWPFLLSAVALAGSGWLIVCEPSTLHRFYRSRIEESFLRVPVGPDGRVNSQPQDWPDKVARPIHVVNCCASDTSYSTTDQIDRRGASVGISAVGGYPSGQGAMCSMRSPSLSEAITASAAAVDPSMGFYSARLGRLVAFVLFAVNLRLGIWWKPSLATVIPSSPVRRYFTSRVSLRPWREMLSQISLPTPSTDPVHTAYAGPGVDLRLTDGGHFDNLAAYEMIRRRCRYVVICDGGADPGNHFAELSSLQRLVRRDFGVEIEIDLDPLRADAGGKSVRHLTAGRILYPSSVDSKRRFSEEGVLIYVKPALTGDEPEDLTQYQAASPTFPHETTTDQFFDDNQWEAYRKLGEHSITRDLRFVTSYLANDKKVYPKLAARLFNAAIRELDSEDHQIHTAKSKTAGWLIDRLTRVPAGWVDELMSELNCIGSGSRTKARKSLLATIRLLESQEESYYQCDLRRHGDHLENWGIENQADRLAASSEVRRWWPVIASLYSIPFRGYLGHKYGLNSLLPFINRELVTVQIQGLSDYWDDETSPKSIQRIQRVRGNAIIDKDDLVLHATVQMVGAQIDLGALAFSLVQEGKTIQIYADDLQVAPGYWSIGINALLMDTVLDIFGFEVSGAGNGSKPKVTGISSATNTAEVQRFIIESSRESSDRSFEKVIRPDDRHSWIQRGFVQTRSGRLVRDQRDQSRAGRCFDRR